MFPSFVMDDIKYSYFADVKFGGNFNLCFVALRKTGTYCSNLVSGEFGIFVILTAFLTRFIHHVVHVVLIGPKKQMSGITARGVVALMQYKDSWGNRTESYLPRNTVGQQWTPFLSAGFINYAVAFIVGSPLPRPTPSALNDSLPKTIFKRLSFSSGNTRQAAEFTASTFDRRGEGVKRVSAMFADAIHAA